MLNNTKYYFLRFFEKVCKFFNILVVFSTRVGIKTLNVASFRKDLDKEVFGECYYSDGRDLFLGPDFLKDKFTLLDCSLYESPHYKFVECLNQGNNPDSTDYIKRYCSGTLDGRIGHCSFSNYSIFFEKNKNRREEIITGIMKPIKVYEWKGRKYIQDGKHRAAMCLLLKKTIPYELIDGKCLFEGITTCMLRLAAKKEQDYSKHIQFFAQ